MFIDKVKIKVKAGKGGDGIVAYRREARVPLGGPFGGNGGKGGDIILKATSNVNTLYDFRYKKDIKGLDGQNGRTKGQFGKNAKDTILLVPLGTIIYDSLDNTKIADLTKDNEELVIAHGGRGGRGNMAFSTGKNPCPNFSERGEPGEYKELLLELKILADCGLIGYPSVGKSTLLNAVSNSKAKTDSYHFTTLNPILGLVRVSDNQEFVMADLPGLIEGASSGIGLGDRFLKHIERCKILVHVIDMSSSEGRDPYEDYLRINKELELYNKNLLKKPQVIVANKMDMPSSLNNLEEFKKKVDKKIFEISAYTKKGLKDLIYYLYDLINTTKIEDSSLEEENESFISYVYKEEEPFFKVTKENDIFYVTGDKLYKLYEMTNFSTDEGIKRFLKKLRDLGLDEELKKQGIKENDTVKIFDYEFEFLE